MKAMPGFVRAVFVLLLVSAGAAFVFAAPASADTPSRMWSHQTPITAHSVVEAPVEHQAGINDRCVSTACAPDCGTCCQMAGSGCCPPAADIGRDIGAWGLRSKASTAPVWCAPRRGGLAPQGGKPPPRSAA